MLIFTVYDIIFSKTKPKKKTREKSRKWDKEKESVGSCGKFNQTMRKEWWRSKETRSKRSDERNMRMRSRVSLHYKLIFIRKFLFVFFSCLIFHLSCALFFCRYWCCHKSAPVRSFEPTRITYAMWIANNDGG